MSVRAIVIEAFHQSLKEANQPRPDLPDDAVLLETGLDSLGFAVLVARLEERLGYDPFTLMDEPYYPRTVKEFVQIYEKYDPKKS